MALLDHQTNPLTDPTRVKSALNALGLRPSKGMGQNFLIDPEPLRLALEAAAVGPDDVVVEVGPGLGVLTWELLRAAGRVIAVELDRRLAARLRAEFAGAPLTLVESDVLEVAPSAMLAAAGLPPETPYKLVANIPYAITSPLLGVTIPHTMLMSVVLPAPLGPRSANISPLRISRLIGLSACRPDA